MEDDKQTRRLVILIAWRPLAQPDKEFRLRVVAEGENGLWSGKAKGRFDYGNNIRCNLVEPGLLKVSIRVEMVRGGTSDEPMISGEIMTMVGASRHMTRLRQTRLIYDGPRCFAEWPLIFVAGLGNTHISLRGDKGRSGGGESARKLMKRSRKRD